VRALTIILDALPEVHVDFPSIKESNANCFMTLLVFQLRKEAAI
jgi:hypothetical protein